MIVIARYIKKYLHEHPETATFYGAPKSNDYSEPGNEICESKPSPRRNSAAGSSIVVSSVMHLTRVINESNSIDE